MQDVDSKNYQLFDIHGNVVYESKKRISLLKYGYAAVHDTSSTTQTVKKNIIDKQGKIIFHNAENVVKTGNKLLFFDEVSIKNGKGAIVNEENLFIRFYPEGKYALPVNNEYFIHKDLILRGNKSKYYSGYRIWSSADRENFINGVELVRKREGLGKLRSTYKESQNKKPSKTELSEHQNDTIPSKIVVRKKMPNGTYSEVDLSEYQVDSAPSKKLTFSFFDRAGFKDGLMYVRFHEYFSEKEYKSSFQGWGYMNEKGEIIYKSPEEKYYSFNGIREKEYPFENYLFDRKKEEEIAEREYYERKVDYGK